VSQSTLAFEGLPAMRGSATHGGDLIVFTMHSLPPGCPLDAGRHGTIEIDGKFEPVTVEGVRHFEDGIETTLRLFTPIIGLAIEEQIMGKSHPDHEPATEDLDQTTKPSERNGGRPPDHPTTARQPQYDNRTTPDVASGDPTE